MDASTLQQKLCCIILEEHWQDGVPYSAKTLYSVLVVFSVFFRRLDDTIDKLMRMGLETEVSVQIIYVTDDVMIMGCGYMYIGHVTYSQLETAGMKRTRKSQSIAKG